ncbi:MAG TPA: helix-turn-helix transcriptional regulator [Flavisolibacter sp.]|nr:helix-turn-helix transcriptional regulator [Flavisolibacter sp.]
MKARRNSKEQGNILEKQKLTIGKVGARIRELRKAKGYTNHDIFAYDHQLDRTQYSKYERGADMRLSSLIKVLAALDISLAEFFEDFD